MKRNVDLSESRIFATPEPLTGLAKLIDDSIEITKPWDYENKPLEIMSDSDFEIRANQRSVIAVGNKKKRQIWKRDHSYDADEICDCCGQSKGKKPWAKNRCNCYSMIYSPRIPWKF